MNSPKNIIILSISSDIGSFLAKSYLEKGCRVVGTYRSQEQLRELKKIKGCQLFYCDIHQKDSVQKFMEEIKALKWTWDTLISCVGYPLPAQPFFETDFEQWRESVEINSIDQLRVLHALYPYRNRKEVSDIVFFAGGGTNNSVVNMSAYTSSKIMLVKMCEFLDAENDDLNIFIVGPGWTKTKIHQLILKDKKVAKQKFSETKEFVEKKQGTPLQEIYECIDWLCREGKPVASGRNFSVVYDAWRQDVRELLLKELKFNPDMYKLRRHKNDFLQKPPQAPS